MTGSIDIGGMLDEALRLCRSGHLDQAETVYRRILAMDAGTADVAGTAIVAANTHVVTPTVPLGAPGVDNRFTLGGNPALWR